MDEPSPTSRPHRRLAGLNPDVLFAHAAGGQRAEDAAPEVGGVEIETALGRGGMGAVFLGRQLSLDREVAIKVLAAELADDPLFLERLEREARLMARLRHPNIVAVHDFQKLGDGGAAIVMEFIEGGSLREKLRAHPGGLPVDEALRIIRQIAAGLATAHEAGVIHRDVKPENVLLDRDGTARVTDFGLALPLHGDSARLTLTGAVAGTVDYMAPEQLRGGDGDARLDIFALGVIAYELLTGQTPRGSFDAPHRVRALVPRHVSVAVMKALRPVANERFASVGALLLALEKPRLAAWRIAAAAAAMGALTWTAVAFFREEKKPAPTAEPQPGPWRDAIAGTVPHRDNLSGGWRYEDGVLLSNDGVCILRLETELPESYDVRMRFTRLTGHHSIALFLQRAGGIVTAELDCWGEGLSGVQTLNGEDLRAGYGFRFGLENGKPCELLVEVRPDEVRMTVDGEFRQAFSIANKQLAPAAPWTLAPRGEAPALAVGSFQSSTRFEKIEWRAR